MKSYTPPFCVYWNKRNPHVKIHHHDCSFHNEESVPIPNICGWEEDIKRYEDALQIAKNIASTNGLPEPTNCEFCFATN